jgi:DNA-binding transcriptional MerR regulator
MITEVNEKAKTYNIHELEELSGISRRIIHNYIQYKMLPQAATKGIEAKYSEEHLIRLIIINAMKKSHIKLSGIRK